MTQFSRKHVCSVVKQEVESGKLFAVHFCGDVRRVLLVEHCEQSLCVLSVVRVRPRAVQFTLPAAELSKQRPFVVHNLNDNFPKVANT